VESQFEAYRKLGYDEVKSSIAGSLRADMAPKKRAGQESGDAKLHEIFEDFGFDVA